MWFIFPQIQGLGTSSTANYFSIESLSEAREFLLHPVLGVRIRECVNILLTKSNPDALAIFGYPDVLKLRSCLTLFEYVAEDEGRFSDALLRYFNGKRDDKTLEILSGEEQVRDN